MRGERRVAEVEEEEEEAGGMIAHLMEEEEVAEEDGGTSALLQDEARLQGGAHLQEGGARHPVDLLQDVEDLLPRGLGCSWHPGLLEVQVEEVVEVGGESVRSRRRNLGDLEAGTVEIVPPGVTPLQEVDVEVDEVTLLQGEALPQEGVHLQEEAALLAGMRGEAMLEVGDAEVEALLQEGALHQGGVLLQGVGHLQGEALLQDAEEVLMMEADPGGEEVEEVKTGALQEGAHLHAVALLQEEVAHLQEGDLLQEEMRAAATEEPGGEEEEEEVEVLHLDAVLHQEGAH